MPVNTPNNEIVTTLAKLRSTYRTGRTRTMEWRVGQLRALRSMLRDNEAAICAALWKDLRKSTFEAVFSEHGLVIEEIDVTLDALADWMKPEPVLTPLSTQPATARIVHDPYGVVLIIGAWNYPINLLLAPLVGAIAGGNAAVLKPSEMSAATSALMADLVPRYLDRDAFAVVEGGASETQSLLSERFDYIFFTGSGRVGQIVLEKAAKYLTPVALELGGKSPCIVDEGANLEVAARRIVWGKFLNAGQTCVAPDYILALPSVERDLIKNMRAAITDFYGEDPQQSPDYCRIVNDRNFQRLTKFLGDGELVCGKQTDAADRYIAPTILRKVSPDAPIMQEEIFGPILPVLTIPDIGAAIEFVNERPKPLSLYVFSENRAHQERILEETSSGGAALNDVIIHMPVPELPFGGVARSGMGHYHGRFSFDAFTHAKGVLDKITHPDVPDRYPPYAKKGARP